MRPRSLRLSHCLWLLNSLLLLAMGCGASESDEAAVPARPPATVADGRAMLDLSQLPLPEGAKKGDHQGFAELSYVGFGTLNDEFEFQRKQLKQLGWKEITGSYIGEGSATASFQKQGYALSLSAMPDPSRPHGVDVRLLHHGNVNLDKLPIPPNCKSFYNTRINVQHLTEAPVEATAAAMHDLLVKAGWEPYGSVIGSEYFRQNAVWLQVSVGAAPAQGGKTVIGFFSRLMSTELPPPPDFERLQYAETVEQLSFDSPHTIDEVADFYRTKLAEQKWQATTDKPIPIDFKSELIFRNPTKDMLTLEMTSFEGKTRGLLYFHSAAQVAEMDEAAKRAIQKIQEEKNRPLPQVSVTLPDDASSVEKAPARIAFHTASAQVQPTVRRFRDEFVKLGWKVEVETTETIAGAISLSQEGKTLSITYENTGFLPASIEVQAIGVQLVVATAEAK